MKEEIKRAIETYNKIAKIYVKYTSEKLLQYQLNKFISFLPKKSKVLDVGCGCGRDVSYFLEENISVIGIDISDEMLKEAKSLNKNAKFQKMDMLSLKFKDNDFDGIWVMASLEDVPKKDAPAALKEFSRVLKKEGVIYIAVKEGKGEKVITKPKYNNLPRFYSFYEQLELENLLRKHNFQIINSIVSNDQGTNWVEIFAKKI